MPAGWTLGQAHRVHGGNDCSGLRRSVQCWGRMGRCVGRARSVAYWRQVVTSGEWARLRVLNLKKSLGVGRMLQARACCAAVACDNSACLVRCLSA